MNASLYSEEARNRKIISSSGIIIIAALSVLILVQIYSYAISSWEIDVKSARFAVKTAALNNFIVIPRLLAFLAIALVLFRNSFRNFSNTLYSFVFFLFCIAHTLLAMLDLGISTALYSSNIPFYYLLIFGFFAGRKEELWLTVKKAILPFTLVYIVAFFYEFAFSYINYGWVIYQNSSVMVYFSNAFWLVATYIYIRISEKGNGLLIYLFPVVLLIGAVIIRSRSWVIQSILLLVIAVIGSVFSGKKRSNRFIRSFILIAVFLGIAALVLYGYFGEFVDSVLDKGATDTRTYQYEEIFAQTPWYKWILGQGMTATYHSSVYGDYSFIDNEFVYLSFHYGVFFATLYFVPYIVAFVKNLKARKNVPAFLFSFGIILLWLASVNGLSVYNRIFFDVKSFVMPFLAGHICKVANDNLQIENTQSTETEIVEAET